MFGKSNYILNFQFFKASNTKDKKNIESHANHSQTKEYNKNLEDSFAKLQLINQQIAHANANKQKAKNLEKSESVLDQYRSLSLAYRLKHIQYWK